MSVLWSSIPLWGPGYIPGHGFTCLSDSVPSQPSFSATLGSRSGSGPAPSPISVVVQSLSHVWLCDPVGCSTPGSSVLHHQLEFAQIHVHWVSDAIQPSHPLLLPSPFAFSLSQHQGPLIFTCLYCSQRYQTGCKPAQLWWWNREIK